MEGVIKSANTNENVAEVKVEQEANTVVTKAETVEKGTVSVLSLKKAIISSAVGGVDIESTSANLANYLITVPSFIVTKSYTEGIGWYNNYLDNGYVFATNIFDKFMATAFDYYRRNKYEAGGRLFADYIEYKAKNPAGSEAVCDVDAAIDYASVEYFAAMVEEKGLVLSEVEYLLRMLEILAPVANENIVKTFNSLINNNNNYSSMSAEAIDFVFTGLGYERNKEV